MYSPSGTLPMTDTGHANGIGASAAEAGHADIIVNCTGLSSLKLGGVEDPKVYPARGQIVLVRNVAPFMACTSGTGDGEEEACYVMMRAAGMHLPICLFAHSLTVPLDSINASAPLQHFLVLLPLLRFICFFICVCRYCCCCYCCCCYCCCCYCCCCYCCCC